MNLVGLDLYCRDLRWHNRHNCKEIVRRQFVSHNREVDMWQLEAYNTDGWWHCSLDKIDVLELLHDDDDGGVLVVEDRVCNPDKLDRTVRLLLPEEVYDGRVLPCCLMGFESHKHERHTQWHKTSLEFGRDCKIKQKKQLVFS